jgi:predicted nucleic acid-binding protein
MKLRDAFRGVTKVFLDTSPVIYYVEANPSFIEGMQAVFTLIEDGVMEAVISPITLAECLTLPIRSEQVEVQQKFIDLLTNTDGIVPVDIDGEMGYRAAQLRVYYGLKLPDALQLAAALSSGCEVFLTNDLALKRVSELQVLVLAELAI